MMHWSWLRVVRRGVPFLPTYTHLELGSAAVRGVQDVSDDALELAAGGAQGEVSWTTNLPVPACC
jgi:hypothetical protein